MGNPTQDTWVDVKQPVQSQAQGQDEWQDVPTGGASGSWSPYNPAYAGKFIPALTKSLYDNAPFGKDIVNAMPNADQIKQNMAATPPPSNLQSELGAAIPPTAIGTAEMLPAAGVASAYGLGTVGSYLAGGAFQHGIQNYQQGKEPSLGDFVGNTALNAVTAGAGTAGSALGTAATKTMGPMAQNIGSRVGTGLGQAAANWFNPMQSNDERPVNTLMSGAMGVAMPQETKVTPESIQSMIQKGGQDFMKILNPGDGIKQEFESQGKDINQTGNLLAENGIIIKKDANGDKDTSQGVQQLQQMLQPLRQQQKAIYNSKNVIFDVGDKDNPTQGSIRQQAYDALKTDPNFKNPLDYSAGKTLIDRELDTTLDDNRYGKFVMGHQLQDLKSGWQDIGYESGNEQRAPIGRLLGNVAKTTLENGYPGQNLQETNAQMGKILDARDLLQRTNGQSIPKNIVNPKSVPIVKAAVPLMGIGLGRLVPGLGEAGGVIGGAMTGAKLGNMLGNKIQEVANDPANITNGWGRKIAQAKATMARQNGVVSPTQNPVMRPQQQPMAQQPVQQPPMSQSSIVQPTPQQVQQFGTPNAPRPVMPQQGGGGVMGGSQNPIHNMPPEALKNLEKQIKIEKIIRS